MANFGILLSCEHGGNEVPPAYQCLFAGHEEVLESHRGWDPGTLDLGKFLAEALGAPLIFSITSRLLIEMNRSLGHAQLFSEYSRPLSIEKKEQLIARYYLPYRKQVLQEIELYQLEGKPSLHFSLHSFTPLWQDLERRVDIGLLFDPARKLESTIAGQIKKQLQQFLPELRICNNEPYLGTDDGLTTYLRTLFPDARYAGLEIEVNQKWVDTPQMSRISESLKQAILTIDAR